MPHAAQACGQREENQRLVSGQGLFAANTSHHGLRIISTRRGLQPVIAKFGITSLCFCLLMVVSSDPGQVLAIPFLLVLSYYQYNGMVQTKPRLSGSEAVWFVYDAMYSR